MRESLSEMEARTFLTAMLKLINKLEDIDGKSHHVALMIFTREGQGENGEDIVSSDVLATTTGEHLQELLHNWIMRKVQ